MGCGPSNRVEDVNGQEAKTRLISQATNDITIQDLETENVTTTKQLEKTLLISDTGHDNILHESGYNQQSPVFRTEDDNNRVNKQKNTEYSNAANDDDIIKKTQIKNDRNKALREKAVTNSQVSNTKRDIFTNNLEPASENVHQERSGENIPPLTPKEDMGLHSSKDGEASKLVPDGRTLETVKHKSWTIEDTFWQGKRNVMPDMKRIRLVDQHAINTPATLHKDPDQLVSHLVSVAQSDLEKYRVIYRWVAENIVYDMELLNYNRITHSNKAEDVLKSGVAVCAGYANLYRHLCQIAGLECVVDHGICKGQGYIVGNGKKLSHAWNRIKIDGDLYGCDCTWSAGFSRIDPSTGRYKFHKNWRESWFMAEPQAHDSSHLPESGRQHVVDIESQLSAEPYKTHREWDNEPHVYPGFFEYGLQNLDTSSSGTIHSKNNSIDIRIKCPYAMRIYPRLQRSGGPEGKFDNHVMWYFLGVIMIMKVRLPVAGTYELKICGYPHEHNEFDEDLDGAWKGALIEYVLVGTGNQKRTPFPQLNGYNWGASWYGHFNGIQPVSLEDPIVNADNGRALIEFTRKDVHGLMFFKYNHEKDPSDDLVQYLYPETDGHRVQLHLLCPKKGSYSCRVFFKLKESGENKQAFQVLVVCNKLAEKQLRYPCDNSGFWGANKLMHTLGITVNGSSSSSVVTEKGEGELSLNLPADVKLAHGLVDVKDGDVSKTWICAESEPKADGSRVIRLRVRCPKTGYYRLNIFANEESKPSLDYAGRWMIICKKPFADKSLLFPDHWGTWGPSGDFHKLRLRVQEPRSSTLHPDDKGMCNLVISSSNSLHTSHRLSTGSGVVLPRNSAEMAKVDDLDSHVVRFNIDVSKLSGFHSLEVFASNSPGRLGYIGKWLVDVGSV